MGEQRTGRTTKMLIQAIQYAADHADTAVLICVGEETHVKQIRITAGKLAKAMGLQIHKGSQWSFGVEDSILHFLPSAGSKEHAQMLRDTWTNFVAFHDHRASGDLEE